MKASLGEKYSLTISLTFFLSDLFKLLRVAIMGLSLQTGTMDKLKDIYFLMLETLT